MSLQTPLQTILLIENDSDTAEVIRSALAQAASSSFEVEWLRSLSDGLLRLGKTGISAILLSFSLPDSEGIQTYHRVFAVAPDIPILIVAGEANEASAKQAVELGAHDYLLPSHCDAYSLPRALQNAIELHSVADALFQEKERAQVTLNSIGDAVLCTDIAGNITFLNLVAETMTGWLRKEALGRPLAEVFKIINGRTRKTARDPMEMAVEQNRTVEPTVDCLLVRRDGFEIAIEDSAAPIHDRAGEVIGAVIVFHDVTAARAMTRRITHSAQHDVVTNLPNRLLLHDRISSAISLARRQQRSIAVLFLDLDHFKGINDSLGHGAGDEVLRSVSKRLLASIRGSDTVSRQGGDEFLILLSEIAAPIDASTIAIKILRSISAPHVIAGTELHVTGSIGISIYPTDGEDTETLIKNADIAMYHAKDGGRDSFQLFKPGMHLKAVERKSLDASMRLALAKDEFRLLYQPEVNLYTGEITGAEALIRWHQPDGRLVPPAQFIPVAEECGLIVDIGRWVLGEACRQARTWELSGLPTVRMAVNVSAVELRHDGFVAGVWAVLAETGLEPRSLVLELTEGTLVADAKSSSLVLQELKAMGVQLAVDDFGTGYSSLSYLRRFPVDILKIDQSFVQQITPDLNDAVIVSAIIGMGESLKHLVIAEGIETQEQCTYLRSRHCAEAQGFFFSPPVDATQFAALLLKGLRKTA